MARGCWILLGMLLGCSGDKSDADTGTEGDTDTDTDTDSDTDTDTDTDTDSDADTDTDTAASPVNGRWSGPCTPNFGTPPDSGYYNYLFETLLGAELQMDLTEQGGDVQGDGFMAFQLLEDSGYIIKGKTGDTGELGFVTTSTYTFTSLLPILTQGNWDGSELALVFAEDHGYGPPAPIPVELTATISGDLMTGALVVYPNATYGYPILPFDCALDRQ